MGNVEPEAVSDGQGGCGAGEDEVPAWREGFDALEAWGGGEGEEVDAAEGRGGKEEEEDGRGWGVGHGVRVVVLGLRLTRGEMGLLWSVEKNMGVNLGGHGGNFPGRDNRAL